MDSLLTQVQELALKADLSARQRICSKLRDLAASIASPESIKLQYGCMFSEQAVAKTAVDLGLFKILDKNQTPMSPNDVALQSGGDPALIARLLRFLAATGMVAETGENLFAASKITHCLASETGGASIHHGFSIRSRAFHELPNFLKGKGYRNVDSALDAPFQKAFNTDMMCFPWMEKHPEHIAAFHTHVPIFQSPQPWPSVLPLKDMLGDTDAKTPIFVDVGGGHGKRSVDFRDAVEAHGISGRIINQDLPKTIEMAPKHRGIEMMEQDMFEEQKIKGARFYYLRAVLHDHPDAKAKAILQRIKEAMDPHSILLIDDLVIPSKGASRVVVQMDITMMALCGAKERTETEWRKLLGDVGFEMRKVHRYHPEIEFAVMEAVVAKT